MAAQAWMAAHVVQAQSGPGGAPQSPFTQYAVIPIRGDIGSNDPEQDHAVTAEGVKAAIHQARGKKIEHIVFHVDTDGGLLHEGERIAEVLEAARGDGRSDTPLKYYAVVRKSLSAGMWVTFSCDRIFVEPIGTQGAALVWTPIDSGHPQVDAKLNAATAKRLSDLARRHGHNGAIAEAMVLLEAELYSWKDEAGRVVVDRSRPSGAVSDLRQEDGATTVLALSSEDAVRLGCATPAPKGIEGLGELLGFDRWQATGEHGRATVERAWDDIAKAEKTRRGLIRDMHGDLDRALEICNRVPSMVRDAEMRDPSNEYYRIDYRSGLYTPEAQRAWRENTDAAIARWRDVEAAIAEVAKIRKDIQQSLKRMERQEAYWRFQEVAAVQADEVETRIEQLETFGSELKDAATKASRERSRLSANRNKTRP